MEERKGRMGKERKWKGWKRERRGRGRREAKWGDRRKERGRLFCTYYCTVQPLFTCTIYYLYYIFQVRELRDGAGPGESVAVVHAVS